MEIKGRNSKVRRLGMGTKARPENKKSVAGFDPEKMLKAYREVSQAHMERHFEIVSEMATPSKSGVGGARKSNK